MKITAVAAALCVWGILLSAADKADLDKRRDALLGEGNLAEVHAADPLLGEYLTWQKRIFANLEEAIKTDPAGAESMMRDYDYLLTRLEGELEHFRTTPAIDETKCYNVKTFGAKGDGSVDDGEAIRKAIAAAAADTEGKRTVFLPRGRYLVRCTGGVTGNIKLENLKDLRIAGERGTELLLPGALDVAILIKGCDNVGVKNLTVTYLKRPYMTGVIAAFPAEDTIRVKRDPGMPAPTEPYFKQAQSKGLMRFHTGGVIPGTLRPLLSSIGPHQGRPDVTMVDEETYDFKIHTYTPAAKHYTPGSRIAFYARTHGNHTINNANSNRTRLENITIHTSSAMAILNNGSDRPFVVNCRIEALPDSFVSTSADGIYMRNISLGGLVKGNIVRHVGDDFMNIHTLVYPADKADGKDIYLKASEYQERFLAPGVRLGLIRISLGKNGVAEERTISSTVKEGDFFRVTLDRPFDKFELRDSTDKLPDMIMSLDQQAHGMIITGNRFEDGVSRFLAGGRNWLFVGNTVIDSLSHSFFMNLCPERVGKNGFEFVSPRNIELAGNRFETVAKTLFRFDGSANRNRAADRTVPGASHIKITGNEIVVERTSQHPLMQTEGGAFLTISGNQIR